MGKYLERINFINNKAPYLNDINLNKLQENVEEAITELHSQGIATGDTLPLGAVIEWYSDIIPENWLLCNGQAISRTNYPELFNVIGTKYGTGNGTTTFNLPNLKGRVAVGKDENDSEFNELGKIGGEKEHTLNIDETPRHIHANAVNNGQGNKEWGLNFTYEGTAAFNSGASEAVGKSQAHNNLQPYIVCNFIIKVKQSSGLVANVVDNLNSTSQTDALSARQGRVLNERIEKKVLWEKGAGEILTFSAQTIQLELSNYDYLIIFYYRSPNSRIETISSLVEINNATELLYTDYFNSVTRAWSRKVEVNKNGVIFSDAYVNSDLNNTLLTPYKIIGCRY